MKKETVEEIGIKEEVVFCHANFINSYFLFSV